MNRWSPEGFGVTRAIELEFLDVSPDAPPEWGDSALGGIWHEIITGLHRAPIALEGAFAIQRVAGVGTLDR